MSRIGLFGGTFDPPHAGHVAAAAAARHTLGLDRLLMVVANQPWQKAGLRTITAPEDRLCMVAAAVADLPGVEVSRLEIDRGGPSYTIDTVDELHDKAVAPGEAPPVLFVVVGADLATTLPTWERADELATRVTVAVVSRPPMAHPAVPAGWTWVPVEGPAVDVSSSQVRTLLSQGADVDGLVPAAVIRCIRRRGLYAVSR